MGEAARTDGIDLSTAMIGLARDRHPEARLFQADICRWELPRSYDLIVAWDSTWHVPLGQQEPVLTKLSASAFTSSNIDALLRNLRVRTLVLTGVSTSQCVDLTARDAADRGYMSVVVEDAVAEDRPDYHEWTLEQFRRLFGRVATTTEVLSEISARLPASARR